VQGSSLPAREGLGASAAVAAPDTQSILDMLLLKVSGRCDDNEGTV
jgi:hypothetical protein